MMDLAVDENPDLNFTQHTKFDKIVAHFVKGFDINDLFLVWPFIKHIVNYRETPVRGKWYLQRKASPSMRSYSLPY